LNQNEEHINELLAKYFAGEALPEEAMRIDEWKNQSEANLRHFNHTQKLMLVAEQTTFDASAMYQRIISRPQQETTVLTLRRYFTPLRIAASLVIVSLIGLSAMLLLRNDTTPDTILASSETVTEQKLADGSVVALNKHSKLTVIGGFNGKQRKVKLEGEAFFEVKHDDEKPFVIDAGGISIKDIGTAFNVNAHPASDSVMVFVTEGIVEITTSTKIKTLHENEGVIYIKSTQAFVSIRQTQTNITAYKTKQFHFNASTLREVVETLNSVYGPVIQLQSPRLAACTITVDFQDETPETIVNIIAQTLGLEIEQHNGIYLLKGTSCTPF
jgi:transmembrane sensor